MLIFILFDFSSWKFKIISKWRWWNIVLRLTDCENFYRFQYTSVTRVAPPLFKWIAFEFISWSLLIKYVCFKKMNFLTAFVSRIVCFAGCQLFFYHAIVQNIKSLIFCWLTDGCLAWSLKTISQWLIDSHSFHEKCVSIFIISYQLVYLFTRRLLKLWGCVPKVKSVWK